MPTIQLPKLSPSEIITTIALLLSLGVTYGTTHQEAMKARADIEEIKATYMRRDVDEAKHEAYMAAIRDMNDRLVRIERKQDAQMSTQQDIREGVQQLNTKPTR